MNFKLLNPPVMKASLTFLLSFVVCFNSFAQCQFPAQYSGNTGSNMTTMLTPDFIASLNIENENAYLVAFSSSGIVVGSSALYGLTQTTISIWGDDTQTSEIDGAYANENISFQLVSGEVIYDVVMPNAVTYTANGLNIQPSAAQISVNCLYGCTAPWAENYNATATDDDGSCYLNGCMDMNACNYSEYATIDDGSCTLPGCTDNTFTEYYHQGYIAGCDDGSCFKATADLGIDAAFFMAPENTGTNMTLGFNLNNNTGLEGSVIGAFTDLNNDGIIEECVGLSDFQNNFFSMALWGDDSTTPEIEGLTANQTDVIFAVLNSSGNVMAFNAEPGFSGFVSNGLSVFVNLDFNVTIYGCMDSSFCNYNEDAEEEDGSCAGSPGCTNNDYVEYDENASCYLEGACVITWQNAYINETEISAGLQASLDATVLAATQAAQVAQDELDAAQAAADQAANDAESVLNATVLAAAQAAQVAQDELDAAQAAADQAANDAESVLNATISNFEALESDYVNLIAELSAPVLIDILEGWNIIGFTLDEPQDVVATFDGIVEHILIVKNNNADVYWPEFGFNGIGDLIPGQGYQIKVTQAIDDFMYPDTNGQRIELSPSVPQWVLDIPVESHPNDTRTIVKVVNLLGQEINVEDASKGSTLIYLYSDGSVEKKLN